MMIDISTHVGVWQEQHVNFDVADLLRLMDSSGIKTAVVSDLGVISGESSVDSSRLAENSRLIHFRGVSPGMDVSLIKNHGAIHGLTVYPTYQPWDFASDEWNDLISLARQECLPIHVYLRFRDPRVLAQSVSSETVLNSLNVMMQGNLDVRLLISGANIYDVQSNIDLFKQDNVWMDTAHLQHPMNSLSKLLALIGDQSIMYGSNSPFYYPYCEVFRIENADISEDTKRRILSENAKAFLNIR